MKKLAGFRIITTFVVLLGLLQSVQCQYLNYNQLSDKIRTLATQYPGLCSVKSLTRTLAGKEIWLITIGTGDKDSKPAIAVVGGVDGKYLLTRDLAYGFAEKILKSSDENDIRELLGKITFYVLTDVSPDASSQYFDQLKYERDINSRPTDDDRDFQMDEDPYEDLNQDGFITQIRVKDPSGEYIESSEDKRVMVKADISKGQTGVYLVYSEGIDNDKDGSFNEDGPGGVDFNRNFTFNYEEFGKYSGQYPVSEVEVKAVADFLYDRFNIYSVFTFGPQDNLNQQSRGNERAEAAQAAPQRNTSEQPSGREMMRRQRGPVTSVMKTDETINKLVSEKYKEITGLKGTPPVVQDPGNFTDWAYYHYGRYSFSTQGWWIASERGKNPEAEYLKFAEKKKISDVFIPWTAVNHPDFPGKTTEVGGIIPFVQLNPPADSLKNLIDSHYKFITAIAAMHPELEFIDIKSEDAGQNIYRMTLKVHNKGIFATCAEIGDQNIWTRIMRITVEPAKGQTILSGTKVQRIQRLQGDESAEFSWLISGKGKTQITAGAANTGTINTSIEFK